MTDARNEEAQKSWLQKLLVFLGILLLSSLVGSLLLLGLSGAGGMALTSDMDIFAAVTDQTLRPYIKAGIGLNHLAIFSGTALLFAYWIYGRAWARYFDVAKIDGDILVQFILLLFLAYPLIGLSASALEYVDLPAWADSLDDASIDSLMKMLQMDGPVDLIVNLIIIALIPAIGEELLFRGVIQKELIRHLDNPHLAIIAASVIFSGFHLQVQGFLPKLIIGLILGYAYYWTRSIWYPMILHFINNGMQVVLLYLTGDELEAMQTEAETPETAHLLIGVSISCFLCYLLIRHIHKNLIKDNHHNV